MVAFILWKKDKDNTNYIKLICWDTEEFKKTYKKFKLITDKDKEYFWTRENFVIF